ncbi:MAG: hypothetical protein JW966_03095 [Anaerolineae bacterium]|nr:hypothetical protein [Anaerolineae bacterium]
MKRTWVCALALGSMLIAAAVLMSGSAGSRPALAQDDPVGTPPPEFTGALLPTEQGAFFSGAGNCTTCHRDMTDANGTNVSINTFWGSTMMANAARDPYWQATVYAEITNLPDYRVVIEDKCATCHMPMARFEVAAEDQSGLVLGAGFTDPDSEFHALAMDGVSCTLCHQIQPDKLGQPDSMAGAFVIDTQQPIGERDVFSRFLVGDAGVAMMQTASGFAPVQSTHITGAELCATCHTLYTPYVDASGEIAGKFPEQMPYFEWQNSDYADRVACQTCHMPRARGEVVTSIVGGEPRSPFAQHAFVGGNVFLQQIFRTFGPDMAVTADSAQFDMTYARVLDQLQNVTAVVAAQPVALAADQLSVDVTLRVRTGHKFPTGFPARRVWLHVTLTDASGAVVFESGAYEPTGRIVGDDHDADPAHYEPHYTTITEPDQVQIYESVMVDTEGAPTTTLLRGAGYVKDNRLLPFGFDKDSAREEITVHGVAADDADFDGGGDTIRYIMKVAGAEGPFTVTVDVLYLSISANWAEKLRVYDGAEAARFVDYYDAVPNVPVVVASASGTFKN